VGISSSEIYAATTLSVGTFGTASDIAFKPNATQRMVVKADTGNVGIGTTSPTAKLHINSITAGVNSFLVEDEANIDTSPFVIKDSGNVGIGILEPTAKLHINSTETGLAPFLVEDTVNQDTTPFIINEFGNVGIGTDAPATKLEVLKTQTPWDEVARFGFGTISDAYLSLRSGKTASDRFVPEVRGYQNSTKTERALTISGVIDSAQDTHTVPNTGFLYGTEEPAVLFKAGKGTFSTDTDNLTNRKIFEFRNMNEPILSMDPTGGIKVFRGVQQTGQELSALNTQFIHINGAGGGNQITSYSFAANTKPLIIQSTTDESHTIAGNTQSEAFPGIVFKIYDTIAALINRDGDVGIGTNKNFANVEARLHVTTATRTSETSPETPGTRGEAFRMWEGHLTTDQVMIAQGGYGQATWGKVNADHMDPTEGYTGTVRVSSPNHPAGYRDFYIKNGIITAILPV
jgi:hypothetical protein